MKSIKKLIVSIALSLVLLLCLSSCSLFGGFDAKGLVEGNLDSVFLNEHSSEYLRMVDISREEAEADYRAGLEVEAAIFASYWGIVEEAYGESYEDLDEGLKNDIIELLDDIYSHTKYEVGEVTSSSKLYTVEVTVYPIDVLEQAYYAIEEYTPYLTWLEKYAEVDITTMTNAEYATYTTEYGNAIVGLVREQLDNVGYTDARSLAIRVEKVDDYWTINAEDFDTFDYYVIYYG